MRLSGFSGLTVTELDENWIPPREHDPTPGAPGDAAVRSRPPFPPREHDPTPGARGPACAAPGSPIPGVWRVAAGVPLGGMTVHSLESLRPHIMQRMS